jgi:hypothetical protein
MNIFSLGKNIKTSKEIQKVKVLFGEIEMN